MAGERTADIGLCRVTGHPSRAHRAFFDTLPFWQGANARFRLTFEATTDIEHESKFIYSIEYSFGENNPSQQLNMSPIKANEKRVYNLVPMRLIYTGDASLVVSEILSKTAISGYQTVYSFNVTNRSWLWLTILAGFLAGLFATIGNLIVHLID